MKDLRPWSVYRHRLHLLIHRDDVAEALAHEAGCPLRTGQLFELALCGWTEEAFFEEAYSWDPEDV